MEVKDLEIKKLKKEIRTSSIKQTGFMILILAEIIFLGAIFADFFNIKNPLSDNISKTKIAQIHIDQEITGKYIEHLIQSVEEVKEDESYKALLVNIASPGGSPSASQEFAEYLKDFNQTKPVVIYIDSMAASGAYYIASAIKPIYANKNAIIGSIGVIMPHYNAGELAKKVGIKEETITAGKFKQPFSILKEMSPEDKVYMENSLLKPAYKNFLEDVAHNRNIPVETLENYAEGKIFIANMPEISGILVDKITNLFKLKNKLQRRYHDAEFITIGKKPSAKNFFEVLFQETLHSLLEEQITLK